MNKTSILLCLLALTIINKAAHSQGRGKDRDKEMICIPAEVIVDKIRGGLLGQMLGNLNGIPHEMKYYDKPGNVSNYVPALPDGARTDDDTDFEWVYIYEMQHRRKALLSSDELQQLWTERMNRGVYCSNLYARYLMDLGLKPPYTGYPTLNPWGDFNISGQFLCETFGLVAPAMPQTAARIGLNYTRVAINGEPAQTTQLFTAMISTAFVEDDVSKILDAGSAAVDKNSKVSRVIGDIRGWYKQYPDNWRETRRLLKENYTLDDDLQRNRNGFELNTGAIMIALLYGNGNFEQSLQIAFNTGWDADCNAATVGTIVGVMYGYRKMLQSNDANPGWQIVDRYRNTTRDNMPKDETITSYADRITEVFEMVNEDQGGRRTVRDNQVVFLIPAERPSPLSGILPADKQREELRIEMENGIKKGIRHADRQDRARASYLAVCLELDEEIKKSDPEAWEKACNDLKGYWRVMHEIFHTSNRGKYIKSMIAMRQRFEAAGFQQPARSYSLDELFVAAQSVRSVERGAISVFHPF